MVDAVGENKFNEYMDTLKKMEEREAKKGLFQAIEGDIDTRKDRGVNIGQ